MKKVLFFVLLLVFLPFSANAEVKCSDVEYGSKNHQEKMEELAKLAGLSDGYYNKYHEGLVSDLCKGNTKNIADLIDNGFVKKSEVEAIMKVLGINEVLAMGDRSEAGKRYGDSRRKFEDMGLCSACADNVAQHYVKKPDSECGKLAKQALDGNSDAIEKLRPFPDYCKWEY